MTAILRGYAPRSLQLRRLIVPDWLWQFTWLRHLPEYFRSITWNDCTRSGWLVAYDLLYIFFILGLVPEHYGPCRLWSVPRRDWPNYYGSPYTPRARGRLAKRVYPLEYEILYNDKVVGAQLCRGLNVRQPRSFAILQPDGPWQQKLTETFRAHDNRQLMLKPVFGRSGMGIVVVEETADGIVVVRTAERSVPLAEFRLEYPAFLQEVIRQDPRIASVWPTSVNTIRVITLLTPADDVLIVATGMRFGVGSSFVDNWSAGGVGVGIDHHTGRLRARGYDKFGNTYTEHPCSHVKFEGFEIPQWQRILDAARHVQRSLPFSRMAGVDICLDEDAQPVLIEVNGLPDLVPQEQLNGPLLENPQLLKAFDDCGLLVSRAHKRLARTRLRGEQPTMEHIDKRTARVGSMSA
jgi:hypothetical protein